jgi:capsular exopolysaccharide synthesis family protein
MNMEVGTNHQNITPAKTDDSEFSFRELLMKSMNYLPLFVIFLLIAFGSAYGYLYYQITQYSSSINLLIKDANRSRGTQSTTVSDQVLPDLFFTSKTNLANEIEVLKSQRLMQRVVIHQQLNTVYYSIGKVNKIEIFDADPSKRFLQFTSVQDSSNSHSVIIHVKEDGQIYVVNGENETVIQNHQPIIMPGFTYMVNIGDPHSFRHDNKYQAVWTPTAAVAGSLAGSLSIAPLNKDATILTISTTSSAQTKSELVLNSLVDEYNSYNIEQNNKVADNTINFINDRLGVISGELDNVETGLKNFRENNNAIDLQSQGSAGLNEIKDLQEKLNEQELMLNVANMISNYINNGDKKYSLVPSNLGITDLTLNQLITAYNDGVLKREGMLKTMGEKNLEVTSLESQLDGLRAKITESINNIKAGYNQAYTAVNNQYKLAMNNLNTIPDKEKQLLEIERQQGIKQNLYLFLLQKREEAGVTRAASVSKSESIDGASSRAITVKSSNIYMLALFAGLGIPFLIVYLMDLLNDRVTTREEILKYTNAPIIGEITHFTDRERKLIAGKTRGILPEQFRVVRTNLRYFLPKNTSGQCILVTSTMPAEGKTFISMNLASVLAVSGRRTVLLEFDMRRPKISESLGIEERSTDLPTFLAGGGNPADLVTKVNEVENLYAVLTGFMPPNPAELLLSDHIANLFTYLKSHFDYIVIDTPPLGVVSDAKVLSDFADMSVYIVRQRFTQRKQLRMLNDIYLEKKLPNLALVVNDVKLRGINSYYGYGYTYGGSYGYDYSHGYGYNGNGKKTSWKKLFRRKA